MAGPRGLAAALLAVLALSSAPRSAAQQEERLVIEYAEQVQRLMQGDSVSYYLDGSVRARRGDLRMTAQHVVILEWLGLADLSRDVHIWDSEKELYADHVTYTDSIDVAVATGNVQVIDRRSGSQLKSQHVVYDRRAGLMTATQKPEMILLPERGKVRPDTGGSARPDTVAAGADTTRGAKPDSAAARAGATGPSASDSTGAEADPTGGARADTTGPSIAAVAKPDTAPEPIHVWSEQVQFFRDRDEIWATDSVLVRRGGDLTAKADTARFARAEEQLHLRGKPRVETDRFYIEAREIDVALPDEELSGMIARGDARASSSADSIPAKALEALGEPSKNSWVTADSLRFVFEDEELRTLFADGAARSLNYSLESREGDAATWALNYLLAGRIALHFDREGQGVERVEASEDGRGVYRTAAVTGAEPATVPATAVPIEGAGGAGGLERSGTGASAERKPALAPAEQGAGRSAPDRSAGGALPQGRDSATPDVAGEPQ